MRTPLVLIFLLAATPVLAQDAAEAPADTGWAGTLVGALSITQASFDNWTAGGENSVSYKLGLDGTAVRTVGRVQQTHRGQLAFGQSKIGGEKIRKIDDLIRYNLLLAYLIDGPVTVVGSVDARTQLADGFNYANDPEAENPVSAFFSPAFFVETVGLGYNPRPFLKTQLGLAAKQTVVSDEELRGFYSLDSDQSLRSEAGLNFAAQFASSLVENVFLKSELDVFQTIVKSSSEGFEKNFDPDVRLKNLLTMKVNQFLNVTGELEFFYDRDLTTELQIRQALAFGFAVTLL